MTSCQSRSSWHSQPVVVGASPELPSRAPAWLCVLAGPYRGNLRIGLEKGLDFNLQGVQQIEHLLHIFAGEMAVLFARNSNSPHGRALGQQRKLQDPTAADIMLARAGPSGVVARARANSGLTGQLPKMCNLNCENRNNLLCQ